jgi:hypothetical protein
MTRFQYINQKIDGYKEDIQKGVLPVSLFTHYIIYSRFDVYKKQGNNINQSVFLTSQEYKITEGWVYNVKKYMEEEI